MKEFILMNKTTGELQVGVRVHFFDSEPTRCGSQYDVRVLNETKFDAWLLKINESWVLATNELVDRANLILGEL